MPDTELRLRVTTPIQEISTVVFRRGDVVRLSDKVGPLLVVTWDNDNTIHVAFERHDGLNLLSIE